MSQVRARLAAAGRDAATVPSLQDGLGNTAEKAKQERGGEAVIAYQSQYMTVARRHEMNTQCSHCGNSGLGVTDQLVYVGGQGHVLQSLCSDRVACWQMHDAKFEPAGAGQRAQGAGDVKWT